MSNPTGASSPFPKPKWVLFESVAYMLGYGIHWYSREGRILNPKSVSPGVSCIAVDNVPGDVDHVGPGSLGILGDKAFDWLFIDHWADDDPGFGELLPRLLRKLKPSGHLILLSKKGFRDLPKLGCKRQIGAEGWYFSVFKNGQIVPKKDSRPRVCLARYGAYGDLVMATPLIRALHEDGYHVTCNVQRYSWEVLRENPYIDNLINQEREAIPNHWLGEYWEYWKGKYDKYINLSESIEGGLLKVEGRRDFYTEKSWRHKEFNVNYQDRTMEIGGYPERTGELPEMFYSKAEEKKVRKFIESATATGRKFLVMCPLRGSSWHKRYPLLGQVMEQWLRGKPDVEVLLTGDASAKDLAFEHPQVTNLIGSSWSLRELMHMAQKVSVVMGPETGLINAVAGDLVPKIVFLSHSTPENLTKYWKNTVALEPDTAIAACYPCHQLHYSMESCPIAQITDKENKPVSTGPVCAMGAIRPEKVIEQLDRIYNAKSVVVV